MPILGSSSGLAYIAFAPRRSEMPCSRCSPGPAIRTTPSPATPASSAGNGASRGTRIPVQAIIDNAADTTAEEIATEIFELTVDVVRRILAYAKSKPP